MIRQRAALPAWAGLLLSLLAAPPAPAQEVRGRLLAEVDGEPLAGAWVALLHDSATVATTLTRADGWFQLPAASAGTYTLRAELLGYRRVELRVRASDEPVWVELRTGRQALELEGLTAEVDRKCETDDGEAARVMRLWDEISKAFRVAAVAEEQGLYRLELDRWRRALDPGDLRVLDEAERRRGSGRQRSSPFESLPPEELEEGGYIQGSDEAGWRYLAPDARVLLSRSFQDTHCFGMERGRPDELRPEVAGDAWTGIRFEPRDRKDPDIRGVLWIDRESLEPRRLDFRYTELPWPVEHDELGGRVGFRRLPEGPWIVSDWRIRMPVIDAEEYRPYASASLRLRYQVAGLTEVGGRVTEVAPGSGEAVTFGETGAVEGRVREASGDPARGALVALEGTFFRTATDSAGRFRLESVPGGRYRVVSASPALEALGLEDEGTAPVQVRPGGTSEVEIFLPDPAALLAERCPSPLSRGARGVLRGVVVPGEGVSLEGVRVELSWSESVDLEMAPGMVGVEVATARATVEVGEDGGWDACGLPTGEPLRVAAVRPDEGGPASESREVVLDGASVPQVVLPLTGIRAFDAPVELEGLTVEVAARVREDLRDIGMRRQALGRRFISTEDIAENLDGAISLAHLVERQRIPGVRVRTREGFECVYTPRGTDPTGPSGVPVQLCASLVVDGVPTDRSLLETLAPSQIAAMAFLRPLEAGARFQDAGGGILYIWTHGGVEGRRDDPR